MQVAEGVADVLAAQRCVVLQGNLFASLGPGPAHFKGDKAPELSQIERGRESSSFKEDRGRWKPLSEKRKQDMLLKDYLPGNGIVDKEVSMFISNPGRRGKACDIDRTLIVLCNDDQVPV